MPIFYFVLVFITILGFPTIGSSEEASLQDLINQASPNQTILIPEGEYQGPIIIDKPLHIEGNHLVIIHSKGQLPAITIKSHHVTLFNIHVKQDGPLDMPGIRMEGDHHKLEQIKIETNGVGIKLYESSNNHLTQIEIQGPSLPQQKLHKGNAIDLWESHHNLITQTTISSVQDGIYIEKSHHNQLLENRIQNSRYGVHLMYADNTHILKNEFLENVTGAMVMVVKNTIVKNNIFIKNQQHVYSQGLLLHEAHRSLVEGNQFRQNRIGVYVESSSHNQFMQNQFEQNFIGFQWKNADQNTLQQNDFKANVIQSQATNSLDNHIQNNYWDDLEGLDTSGDGKSELAYPIDPYFLTITEYYPAFQLLFQSPGVILLKQLFKSNEKRILKDEAPSIQPHFSYRAEASTTPLPIWSILLLLSSGSIFVLGRK